VGHDAQSCNGSPFWTRLVGPALRGERFLSCMCA
jgi:hypothetical protein